MKKLALLSSLALAAAASPLLGQTILFQDDFSTSGPNNTADPAKWNVYRNSPFDSAKLVEVTSANSEALFGEADNNYLRIYKEDSGTSSLWVAASNQFSSGSTVITATFDFVAPIRDGVFTGNPDPRVRFGINDPVSSNNNRVPGEIHFTRGGDGAISNVENVYTPGQKHNIQIAYNHSSSDVSYMGRTLASSSYDVWIDGSYSFSSASNLSPVGIGLDTPLTSIAIGAFSGTSGELFIDNLIVYEGAHVIPEPSTYALGAGILALGAAWMWRRRRAA